MVNYWLDEARVLEEADYGRMNMPVRYRDAVWDRVPEGSAKKFVGVYLEKLRMMRDEGTGFYVYGPNGHGKTALACIVLRAFRSHGQPCLFVRHSKLIRSAYKDIRLFEDAPPLWDLSRSVDVLLIDDFGKAHESESGFSDAELEDLLRDRYDNRLVTIFTSNLSGTKLAERGVIESTISVLQGMAVPLGLIGEGQRAQESKDVLSMLLGEIDE